MYTEVIEVRLAEYAVAAVSNFSVYSDESWDIIDLVLKTLT